MTLFRLSFIDNPIARMEYRHQRHVINSSRSGRGWIALALVMLVPGLLGGLGMFAMALVGIDAIETDSALLGALLNIPVALMMIMNFALYIMVLLITMGLAAASITRERSGRTWEPLLLTNVDARAIVMGKWWASLRALWGDHAMIALLRLGMVGYMVIFLREPWNWPETALPVALAYTLPLALLAIAYTAVDAAFTAALGVIAPLMTLPAGVGGALVVSLRVMLSLPALLWFFWMGLFIAAGGPQVILWMGQIVALYALFTLFILWIGQRFAVRGQVSPAARAN